MNEGVHVGVDGGGTRARAVALDGAGVELARAAGGAGLVDPREPARAAAAVAALVRDVAAAAGAAVPVASLGCGLAGAGRAAERDAVHSALAREGVADRIVVVSDAAAAMHDAFGRGSGVLLIAGTGSIAWSRDLAGRDVRVGGWGALLGDEGSGYAIGLAALREVARAADGRSEQTLLTAAVMERTAVADLDSLIRWSAAAGKADIAALAPVVLACAAVDDAAACAIRSTAVARLVELALCAASRAGLDDVRFALAGGLLEPGGPMRDEVSAALRRSLIAATLLERAVDGAIGAAHIARG